MEIIFFCLLIICSGLYLAQGEWKFKSFLNLWLYIASFASIFRILLFLNPADAPLYSRIIIIGAFLFQIFFIFTKSIKLYLPSKSLIPFFVLVFILLIRSIFPQFDTDSLAYHLSAISWLYDQSIIPAEQFSADMAYINYRLIGIENFLLIAAADLNLALWGGLIAGFIKSLCLLTLISMLPKKLLLTLFLAAYLLLIDDHYLFSAHSKNIFLNPMFIMFACLSAYLCMQLMRARKMYYLYFLSVAACLVASKYHGAIFILILLPFFVFAFLRDCKNKKDLMLILKNNGGYVLLPGFLCAFAVFGLNWIEAGSPLYPFGLGLFYENSGSLHLRYLQDNTGMTLSHAATNKMSIVEKLLYFIKNDHYRIFTYSGNLALKMSVVLFPFASLLLLAKRIKLFQTKLREIDEQHLRNAIFFFLCSFMWVLFCTLYSYVEARYHGRYPRYTFMIAILGVCYFVAAFYAFFLDKISKKLLVSLQYILGSLLLIYLIATLDTRFYNVPPAHRVSWSTLMKYWQEGVGAKITYEIRKFPLLQSDELESDIYPLMDCFVESIGVSESNKAFIRGNRVILLEGGQEWPNFYFLANAVRPDLNFGLDIDISFYEYIVFRKGFFSKKLNKDPLLERIFANLNKNTLVCETNKYKILKRASLK